MHARHVEYRERVRRRRREFQRSLCSVFKALRNSFWEAIAHRANSPPFQQPVVEWREFVLLATRNDHRRLFRST